MHWTLPRRPQAPRYHRGFTLLELMAATAIIAILGSLSVASYRGYVIRARTAQTLVHFDHIRTVVAVERAGGTTDDLAVGAVAGRAPPRLAGLLSDDDLIGVFGHTLWFFKAPEGTFASYPDSEVYALLASADNAEQLKALYALRWGLPLADGDMPWLTTESFAFPLDSLAGGGGGEGPRPRSRSGV